MNPKLSFMFILWATAAYWASEANWVSAVGAEEILVYTLDEGSGVTAVDQTGKGRDGLIIDAAWQPGGFNGRGYALSFGGGTRVEDKDGEDYLNGQDALTMAAWIRSGSINSDHGIFNGKVPDDRDNVCTLRYDVAGESFGGTNLIRMAVTADSEQVLESSSNVQTTEWQHVAMTWESGGLIRFYINGAEDLGARRRGPNNTGTITGCETFIVGQGGKDLSDSWDGLIDEVRLFDAALMQADIQLIMLGDAKEVAKTPLPRSDATGVNRDTSLMWQAGDYAATHNVFLGTSLEDVHDATADHSGGVVLAQGLTETVFAPGRLEFGTTYYWRVDEVNSGPDFTVFAGTLWNFTTEAISIPMTDVTAATSSSFGDSVVERTIDGSGLVGDLHGTLADDMWISSGIPATIEYTFGRVYKLHELLIWNANQAIESLVGFGAKDVVIEHSLDGVTWTTLDGVGPLARGPGAEGYAANNHIDFGGITAQHVRLTIKSVQGRSTGNTGFERRIRGGCARYSMEIWWSA